VPPTRLSYRQIADDLEARIRAGEYPPGALLPSYAKVAEMYSVGTTTAQAAMRELRGRGLTRSVLGMGTYVVGGPDDE
jgi:GntR family transcriptional regulator